MSPEKRRLLGYHSGVKKTPETLREYLVHVFPVGRKTKKTHHRGGCHIGRGWRDAAPGAVEPRGIPTCRTCRTILMRRATRILGPRVIFPKQVHEESVMIGDMDTCQQDRSEELDLSEGFVIREVVEETGGYTNWGVPVRWLDPRIEGLLVDNQY